MSLSKETGYVRVYYKIEFKMNAGASGLFIYWLSTSSVQPSQVHQITVDATHGHIMSNIEILFDRSLTRNYFLCQTQMGNTIYACSSAELHLTFHKVRIFSKVHQAVHLSMNFSIFFYTYIFGYTYLLNHHSLTWFSVYKGPVWWWSLSTSLKIHRGQGGHTLQPWKSRTSIFCAKSTITTANGSCPKTDTDGWEKR